MDFKICIYEDSSFGLIKAKTNKVKDILPPCQVLSAQYDGKQVIRLYRKEKTTILKFATVDEAHEWYLFISEAKKVHRFDRSCKNNCRAPAKESFQS